MLLGVLPPKPPCRLHSKVTLSPCRRTLTSLRFWRANSLVPHRQTAVVSTRKDDVDGDRGSLCYNPLDCRTPTVAVPVTQYLEHEQDVLPAAIVLQNVPVSAPLHIGDVTTFDNVAGPEPSVSLEQEKLVLEASLACPAYSPDRQEEQLALKEQQLALKEQQLSLKEQQLPGEASGGCTTHHPEYDQQQRQANHVHSCPEGASTSTSQQPAEFQKGKCIALTVLYLAAAYTSSILETVKDAVVVTALGAEVLPVLSLFFILPTSVGAMLLYNKLLDQYSNETVFTIMLGVLIGFYALFSAVLYPSRAVLQPTALGAQLMCHLPTAFDPLVKACTHWVYSLFFAMCELWNPIAISVLFYGSANEICSLSEAKTLYPSIGIIANLSVVFAGVVAQLVVKHVAKGSMSVSLCCLTGTMAASAVVMVLCKRFLMRQGYQKKSNQKKSTPSIQTAPVTERKQTKPRQGLSGVLDTLKQSRSISLLAMLVACYGLSHKLFEFTWKGHLRTEFPVATDYQNIMAQVQMCTGVLTLVCMISARFVFTHLGWSFAASCTPVLLLLSGSAFFGLCLASKFNLSIFGTSPQELSTAGAYVGSAAQVFTRSTRYSFLDPAKEMSYLELSDTERSKGKAAVDMVGSQIGKSGASCLIQGLIIALGSLSKAMPIVGVVFVGIVCFWLAAIYRLRSEKSTAAAPRTDTHGGAALAMA